jgi:DNA-binding transcriptional MerR regulator
MATAEKAPGAFRTIGELSEELGVAQHILRYWETKFPQLRPLQRAGNRRYYRPADVDLARRIHRLLTQDGYTVRGVQKLLRDKLGATDDRSAEAEADVSPARTMTANRVEPAPPAAPAIDVARLIDLRNRLASALDG